MKAHKTLIGALITLVVTAQTSWGQSSIDVNRSIRPHPQSLQVWVWPNRGEGATYYPGDPIEISVESNFDCYIMVYNIDTRGRVRILYPYSPHDRNFIQGGRTYILPRPYGDVEWTVEGPAGIEQVQVVASTYPIDLPMWPVYLEKINAGYSSYPEFDDFICRGDRYGYIEKINRRIVPQHWDYCATDLTEFYIAQRPYYHPRPPIDIDIDISWHNHPWWKICGFWPEIFYGGVWIDQPVGARIYIDGVFIGMAPLWYNARHYGRHRIACYEGDHLIRERWVNVSHKRDYREAPRAPERYKNGTFHRSAPIQPKAPRFREDAYDKLPVKQERRERPNSGTVERRPNSPDSKRNKLEYRGDAGKEMSTSAKPSVAKEPVKQPRTTKPKVPVDTESKSTVSKKVPVSRPEKQVPTVTSATKTKVASGKSGTTKSTEKRVSRAGAEDKSDAATTASRESPSVKRVSKGKR